MKEHISPPNSSESSFLLGMKRLRTLVYHPQMDGLVERFNQTLKSMLRKLSVEEFCRWDQFLPLAIREVPQASTNFSPFKLLYGRQPRGLLDLVRETWEQTVSQTKGLRQYFSQLQECLAKARALVKETLQAAQGTQAQGT